MYIVVIAVLVLAFFGVTATGYAGERWRGPSRMMMSWNPRRDPFEVAASLHHAEPPVAAAALEEYDVALRRGNPRALLPTAMILDHGVYQGPEPVQPDRAAALELYRHAAMVGDTRDRAEARDRLWELGEARPPRPQPVPFTIPIVPAWTPTLVGTAAAAAAPRPPRPRHPAAARSGVGLPDRVARSDSQNVHDSSVVRSVRKALASLPPSPLSTEDTLVQVRRALKSEDAHKGLDLVERNTTPLTSLQMKEVDVLRKVWGRIMSFPQGSQEQEDVVQMLEHRLAESGREASCASGRVGRIVDALSTFDDRVHLRPIWALRQEMLHKAGRIRDQRPSSDARPLHEALREEFKRAYVDTGLTTMNIVDAELASWGTDL